ncbi:MAG: DNA mismatch endonuclease Vsr [Candidatus Moranbacteria bacterium]|jgi:DNA mismatch endonuclease (patch repair protein)|nr:DNA mismatch endonuclease Vsr [Candidatus Moranbacteria bacterium]
MADKFCPEKRSQIMANIKGRNTAPERLVKSCLRRLKRKYRSNVQTLEGKPDILLVEQKKLIFVHGCFWHGHNGCQRATRPKTNREFWEKKITGNIERDKRCIRSLRQDGWSVLVVWQCQTKDINLLQKRLSRFIMR